jgi:hypothetical protein
LDPGTAQSAWPRAPRKAAGADCEMMVSWGFNHQNGS